MTHGRTLPAWVRFTAIAPVLLLSGCASVRVDVRQRPLRNEFLYRVVDAHGQRSVCYVDELNQRYTILPPRILPLDELSFSLDPIENSVHLSVLLPDEPRLDPDRFSREEKRLALERLGARIYTWPAMQRVFPGDDGYPEGNLMPEIIRNPSVDVKESTKPWFEWSVAEQNKHRQSEAIKVTQLFWGLAERAITKPVRYDLYERIEALPIAKWGWRALSPFFVIQNAWNVMRPQLSRNRYYVRPNADDSREYWEKEDLLLLEGAHPSPAVLVFRVLTLGMFWDTGYTTDDEEWGLHNSAKAWGWLGKGTYVLVQDRETMQFRVKGISFDPSATVNAVSQIMRDAAVGGLAARSPVLSPQGVPYVDEVGESAAQLATQLAAKRENLANSEAIPLRAELLRKELQQNLERLRALRGQGQATEPFVYVRGPRGLPSKPD